MESIAVVNALSALAHATRLEVFRCLVRAGEGGLAAGDLAQRLDVSPSTLSHHLAQLEHAHIVTATRQSRHIFYAVNFAQVRGLLGYLIEDCCEGAPALCGFTRITTGESCHAD
ncbi:ArsR/SmtB family transcription factor [Sphingobium subterraneum]|uniref:DNA-binding transcriptional ArsR family regulator n=1 Tax=Sphingobium subterraneum TaxID=627688 RepID=A0A841IZ00_9SPHN|nr:metalloregulator ArsR/SmtB family transcription factor [Sphingobium subterraneum]MBB6123550.1 DNA-binding transcriptional ArsR family regulator [Sphingobium subterraneum]